MTQLNDTQHITRATPQQLLESILAHSPKGIIVLDPDERVRECNAEAARLCGTTPQDILGREWASLGLEPAREELFDGAGSDDHCATILRVPGDPRASFASTSHAIRDPDGHVIATLKFIRQAEGAEGPSRIAEARERALSDALRALRRSHEELKTAQLQLIQAAKLESLGRLAAGVAHEVKNPLAILLTGVQLMQRRASDAQTLELLGDLEVAVRRANGVVIGLLDFAVATALKLEPVGVEDVVSESLRLVRHEVDQRQIRLRWEKATAMPRLQLDHTKIEQVVVNLLINAMDAMSAGGEINVRTSVRQLVRVGHGVGYRKVDRLRVGQTVAVIEVEDTGTGIPIDVLAHVFEPFYTTKPAGKGTGLGLAVCGMIAELHQGSVWLENRSEGGTRATLWLPAGEAKTKGSS